MTFLELAEEVLKTAKEPLTLKQIWEIAISQELDKKVGSKGKTPMDTLSAQIYTAIKEKSDSKFCIASKRPTTFWLKEREKELPPLDILKQKIQEAQEKEIEEKGKNKWNYPDIVGIHFPFDDYKEETLGLLKNLNKQSCKIYSFEIKKSITWADIKEYYFQAVSNSSWANEGYLVVFENIESDIFSELIRLNASFGIGIIQLEIDSSSKVILPARQRNLDMQTLDMLVEKNKNFKDFIDDVNKDINANDKFRIAKDRYDKILNDDGLEKYIKEKHISKEE